MRRIIFILMALLTSTGAGAEAENIVAKVKVRNGGTITWIDIRGTIDGTNFTTGAYYNNDDACISWETTGAIDLNEVWSGEGTGTPYTVTSIGKYAFEHCSGLTSIEIPNSVTGIGEFAFSGCSSLEEIKVQEGNKKYDSRNNCNALIETASNTLITGCKNTVIPATVTSIRSSAFYGCSGLTSIEIPSSVTSIGGSAFYMCESLTSIEIPSSVTSIGEYAFSDCTGLTSIEIPNSVTSIRSSMFYCCSSLEEIKVEAGNKKYDSRDNCNAIIETASNTLVLGCKNTVIPATVTSIGDDAFAYCRGLTSIEIPNSVTSIGSGAFYGCI